MLVDTFINAIFLYDDKVVITFNYSEGGKTITHEDVTSSGMDLAGEPRRSKVRSTQSREDSAESPGFSQRSLAPPFHEKSAIFHGREPRLRSLRARGFWSVGEVLLWGKPGPLGGPVLWWGVGERMLR